MLSLQNCRVLLGTDCNLTDVEVEQFRQQLYAFADVAVEAFCASRKGGLRPTNQGCLDAIPAQERESVAERAAILEYEGNLRTAEAERQAFGEWARSKKTPRNHRKSL